MPYRQAPYWMILVAVVTVAGFWGSYFTRLESARLAFHAHAVTALGWVVLVAVQSWTIHHGKRSLHRVTGKLSLVLFPLLMASFVGIINVSAERFLEPDNIFFHTYAPVFGYTMMLALAAYLTLYFLALRHRRNLWWHAGFMLATPLILWESPFSRLIERWVPGQQVNTPAEFPLVGYQIAFSIGMAIVFALWLWWKHGQRGKPFAVAAVFMLVQVAGMYLTAPAAWWHELFRRYAELPGILTIGAGLLAGILVAWLGWRFPAPRQPMVRAQAVSAGSAET